MKYYQVIHKGEEIDAGYADKHAVAQNGTLTIPRYTSVGVAHIQYLKGEWDRFKVDGVEPHIQGAE